MICTNETFRGLPMDDRELLAHVARAVIRGMVSTMRGGLKSLQTPRRRRGTCIVERCARVIEASCGACRRPDCVRCEIAAELRAAEDRVNAERDAELAELGLDENDVEEVLDKMVEGLCGEHVPFGTVIVEEWYGRRTLLVASPGADAAELP